MRLLPFLGLSVVLCGGCSGVLSEVDAGSFVDGGATDGGHEVDSGVDAGTASDAGRDAGMAADAGLRDAGAVDAGGRGVDAGMVLPPVECATPVQQAVDTSSWPETFVGTASQGCSDEASSGTRVKPLCNPHLAMARVKAAGSIVTFLDGVYRLADFVNASGGRGGVSVPQVTATASSFVVVRAAQGARPVLLGSVRLSGGWTQSGSSPRLWRRPIDSLQNDVTALYQVIDGPEAIFTRARRFRHVMVAPSGVRSHAPTAALSEGAMGSVETSMTEDESTRNFTWTKADDSGAACSGSNTGCFIYLRADDASFDANALEFEVPQSTAIGGYGRYTVVDGLHTRFTQCAGQNCSLFFEGATNVLVQNGSFGHVSNSDDNSYGLALWFSNGSIVRRNVVFDSAYWGGTPNSKGITFMVSGNTAPNWVCENEVYHVPGTSGISTKGGVSNLNVLGNHVHDCYAGIESSHYRDQDGQTYAAGGWVISRNIIERCQDGVVMSRNGDPRDQPGDLIANNLFIGNRFGVALGNSTPPDAHIFDNIFLAPAGASACTSNECDTGLYFANNGAQVRDYEYLFNEPFSMRTSHNLYFGYRWTHGVNRNWTPDYINRDLPMFQQAFSSFGAEVGSLAVDPQLGADYKPRAGSPVIGAGVDGGSIGLY